MIGYFDPDKLTMTDEGAVIPFINRADAKDIVDIHITNSAEARRVAKCIVVQRDTGISSSIGIPANLQGPTTMNPAEPREGFMLVDNLPEKVIRFRIAEGVNVQGDIPEHGVMGGFGYVLDGVFIVEQAVIMPAVASHEPNAAPTAAA